MPQSAIISAAIQNMANLDEGRGDALRVVAQAVASAAAVRTALQNHQNHFGGVNFQQEGDHLDDPTVVGDDKAIDLRRAAAKRLLELSIETKSDLTDEADLSYIATAPDNQIRTRLNKRVGVGNINFQQDGDHRNNDNILTDTDAKYIRSVAAAKLISLHISQIANLGKDNEALLLEIANSSNAQALRQVLNRRNEQLGGLNLLNHIQDESRISTPATENLRRDAIEKLVSLKVAAITSLDDGQEQALLAVATAVDDEGIRRALRGQRHFGNISFSFQDQSGVRSQIAQELRRVAVEKLLSLKIVAMSSLAEGRDDALLQIATAANANSIRQALQDGRQHWGEIDLTQFIENPDRVRDTAAEELRVVAIEKLLSLKIAAMSDLADGREAALLQIATNPDPRTIRQALQDHRQHLGNIDLAGFIENGLRVPDEVTQRLRTIAVAKLVELKITSIKTLSVLDDKSALQSLANAPGENDIRVVINQNLRLGNVNFQGATNNNSVLSNADANSLQNKAAYRLAQLSVDTADETKLTVLANAVDDAVICTALSGAAELGGIENPLLVLTSQQRNELRSLAAFRLLTQKIHEHETKGDIKHLREIAHTANANATREKLHTHRSLFGVNFNTKIDRRRDQSLLTDDQATALRQESAFFVIALAIIGKTDLTHATQLRAVANADSPTDIRTQLNTYQSQLGGINFATPGAEVVLKDGQTKRLRQAAIVQLIKLSLITKENAEVQVLSAMARANTPEAMRDAARTYCNSLGGIVITEHNKNLIPTEAINTFRRIAIDRLIFVKISEMLNLDDDRDGALAEIASADSDNDIRQALNTHCAHFGLDGIALEANLDDGQPLISPNAVKRLRSLAASKLVELKIDSIVDLSTAPNRAALVNLSNAVGETAVREVINNNLQLGHINLHNNVRNQAVISDERAQFLQKKAAYRVAELSIMVGQSSYGMIGAFSRLAKASNDADIHSILKRNQELGEINNPSLLTKDQRTSLQALAKIRERQEIILSAINRKTLANVAGLQAVASATDANDIRMKLSIYRAELGDVDLRGHIHDDEKMIPNRVATFLRSAAAIKLVELKIFSMENTLAVADRPVFQGLANAVSADAVRGVINQNAQWGGINLNLHVNDGVIISDEKALSWRNIVAYRLVQRSIEKAADPVLTQLANAPADIDICNILNDNAQLGGVTDSNRVLTADQRSHFRSLATLKLLTRKINNPESDTDHLRAVANAVDVNAIRTAFHTQQAIFGVNFDTSGAGGADHQQANTLLTQVQAQTLKRQAALEVIRRTINSKVAIHGDSLLAVASSADPSWVRQSLALHQAELGGINFPPPFANQDILTDEQTRIVRQLAAFQFSKLSLAAKNIEDEVLLQGIARETDPKSIRRLLGTDLERISDDSAHLLRREAIEKLLSLKITAVEDLTQGREGALQAIAQAQTDDDIRHVLHNQRVYVGDIDLSLDLAGQSLVRNEVAQELRRLAIKQLITLKIRTVSNLVVVSAVAKADNFFAIRQALHNQRDHLGDVSLNGHLDNNSLVKEDVAQELRRAAIEKLLQLKLAAIGDLNGDHEVILFQIAQAANPTAIRQAVQNRRVRLGGIDLTDHEADNDLISNEVAEGLRRIAIEKLVSLKIKAITSLADNREALLLQIARANTAIEVRQALQDQRAYLGNVNLAGNIDNATYISDISTDRVRREAVEKLLRLKIAAMPNLADDREVTLSQLASATTDEAIRQALSQKSSLGGINLEGHTQDENLVRNPVAQELRREATEKLFSLKIALMPNLAEGREALLLALIGQNNDSTRIRQTLSQQNSLGGIDLTGHTNDGTRVRDSAAKELCCLAAKKLFSLKIETINLEVAAVFQAVRAIALANSPQIIRQTMSRQGVHLGINLARSCEDATLISDAIARELRCVAIRRVISAHILFRDDLRNEGMLGEIANAVDEGVIRQILQNYSNSLGGIRLDRHINDETLVSNPVAQELRRLAIATLLSLKITAMENVDDGRQQALSEIARAIAPRDIRQALHTYRRHLGDVNLLPDIDHQSLISDSTAIELRRNAMEKLLQLKLDAVANLAEGREEMLFAIARSETDDAVREALNLHRVHLGNVDFTAHIKDQLYVTDILARSLRRVATERLFRLKIVEMTSLTVGGETLLREIINAPDEDAIRRAVNQQSHLGNINLTGHTDSDQTRVRDVEAQRLRLFAIFKLVELKISAVTDVEGDLNQLRLLATADQPNAIRGAISGNAYLGGINFNDHVNDAEVLSDEGARFLQNKAAYHLVQLAIDDSGLEDEYPEELKGLANAANEEAIRVVLKDNLELGNIDPSVLEPRQLLKLRSLAAQKLLTLKILNSPADSDSVKEVANAPDADTVRERLQVHYESDVNFNNGVDYRRNENLLKNTQATQLRREAAMHVIRSAIAAKVDFAADRAVLRDIAMAIDAEPIRARLDVHQDQLGGIHFAGHTNDDHVLTGLQAQEVRQLALTRLCMLSIAEKCDWRNQTVIKAIAEAETSNAMQAALKSLVGMDMDTAIIPIPSIEKLKTLANQQYQYLQWLASKNRVYQTRAVQACQIDEKMGDQGSDAVMQLIAQEDLLKSEFKAIAQAMDPMVNLEAVQAIVAHKGKPEQKTVGYQVSFPNGRGQFKRKCVDAITAEYKLNGKQELAAKFEKLAKGVEKEFRIKGKPLNEVTLQNIEPSTDEAREACRQAFEARGFTVKIIGEAEALVASV